MNSLTTPHIVDLPFQCNNPSNSSVRGCKYCGAPLSPSRGKNQNSKIYCSSQHKFRARQLRFRARQRRAYILLKFMERECPSALARIEAAMG